ncbi:hypothetical protein BDR07DRAFT_1484740 [Suillus spraguei]|nr:hypothetical protein BDR07DRAFT_1484740 [Suillus spraguei]
MLLRQLRCSRTFCLPSSWLITPMLVKGIAELFKGNRSVPDWKLEELDLRDNEISKLPAELGLLPLDVFLVDGNLFRIPQRRALAITLLSIVPHAADVERLFSDMGSTQSPKRCNLSVDTLEALAKIRANLRYHTQKAVANGKPTRRRHAHMHTGAQPGINVEIAADLEANFAWAPPLAPQTENIDDDLAGPESISLDENLPCWNTKKNPWNEC